MRRPSIALALPLALIGVALPTSAASAAPPLNDAFLDAKPITLDFTEDVDTSEATNDDPEDEAARAACNAPTSDASIWYTLTVESTQWVILSSSLESYSSGANALIDTGDGFECIAGGPGGSYFIGEPGVTYYIQVIDDQLDGGGNGGDVTFSAVSGGEPEPEICPGLIPNDPGAPPLNVIVGTDGHDVLRGTPGDDLIIGRAGDDDINGRGGNDVIIGCDGDDHIHGGGGDDVIFGDSFDFFGDPTSTSGGNDVIRGGPGDDEIRGGPGDDHIHGGSGDDGLFGNQGDDDISGNGGSDFLGGGFGNDLVTGNGGDDFVSGGFGDDELRGGGGDDFITGDLPNGQEDVDPNHDHCNGGGGTNEIVFCEDDQKH